MNTAWINHSVPEEVKPDWLLEALIKKLNISNTECNGKNQCISLYVLDKLKPIEKESSRKQGGKIVSLTTEIEVYTNSC